MAVDPKIPKPQPTTIVTTAVRTEVQRGVDLTGAPVGRGHGGRWHRRRRLGRHGISLTQGTEGLSVKPSNGWGSLERLRLGLRGSGRAGEAGAVTARLGQVRCKMTKSQRSAQRTSREKKRGETMALPPPTYAEMRAFYPVLGPWNEPQSSGTRPGAAASHEPRRLRPEPCLGSSQSLYSAQAARQPRPFCGDAPPDHFSPGDDSWPRPPRLDAMPRFPMIK